MQTGCDADESRLQYWTATSACRNPRSGTRRNCRRSGRCRGGIRGVTRGRHGLHKTIDVKLLSCPCLPSWRCFLWVGRSRQASESKLDVSKTIFADCFSLWLRGEDAGSPGDHLHACRPLGSVWVLWFNDNLRESSSPIAMMHSGNL